MTIPIIRIIHPDGTETPVTVANRTTLEERRGESVGNRIPYTLHRTLIEVQWNGHTGYVLEVIGGGYQAHQSYQPCNEAGAIYDRPHRHFDDAVAVVMNHVTPV